MYFRIHTVYVCDIISMLCVMWSSSMTWYTTHVKPTLVFHVYQTRIIKKKRKADLLNFLVVQGAGFLYPFNLNCCKYFKIFYGCNKVCFCCQLLRLLTIYLRILIHPTFPSSVKFLCLAVSYNLGVDKIKPRDNKYFSPMIGLTEPCKTLFTNFFQK